MSIASEKELKAPSQHNWRTTDQEEIDRRRWRAQTESFTISNRDARHPIFSNFSVKSGSGLTYGVEIRDLAQRHFSCECVDFRINGLGTCKHVEAVLGNLQGRFKRLLKAAAEKGSTRIEIVPDGARDTLRIVNGHGPLPAQVRRWFAADGTLAHASPEEAIEALAGLGKEEHPSLRLSQEITPWLEGRKRLAERKQLRRAYELKVQSGEWPLQETKVALFPYQREGMLHLAFTERALLADEMGLGKTIQAIAACALVHRLGKASRALVVTPASLKTEWEEQIQRFTPLSYQLVFGPRHERLKAYQAAAQPGGPFFTIVNYEQMLADSLEVNERLRPDIVVLDEAQRIKNWSAKTTQAIKRLKSRYAFILTGTPIENRLDELYSLMDFLDPSLLGPLFRFNREFYELDDRGRPSGYRDLAGLHERIRPYLLRRRKAEVETELPERTDRNFFIPMSATQKAAYDDHEGVVARFASIAARRPLTQPESDKLLRHLAMMRMVCDTNYILDEEDRTCPKLAELEKILEECRDNPGVKVIIFSEWERMLELVRELCEKLDLGFAWHTGSVPQRRRRAEIITFKTDPDCRVFLSTDSGATGLNLQNATVVINCDLPWTPAKLEQRIARAWRKHQTRPVTVMNLISENTIEHRMLETLANKQALSDGVLDMKGDLGAIKLRSGRQAFLEKLSQIMTATTMPVRPPAAPPKPPLPADRASGFAQAAARQIQAGLLRCEERYPQAGMHSVIYVVVDREAANHREKLMAIHDEYFAGTDPLAPVRLEVVDRATDEALQRLIEAGLVMKTTRASRPLFPSETSETSTALSQSEKDKAAAHRVQANRKLKMAALLGEGGLDEESKSPLLEGIHALARALAVEARLPEPTDLRDVILPPLSHCWKGALSAVRACVDGTSADWKVIEQIKATEISS